MKTILVCGHGGKSYANRLVLESIKSGGFNVVISPQRSKKLLFDIDGYCKNPSDEMIDAIEKLLSYSQTPIRATDLLETKKTKKIKFHNDLRDKLNTGGVKWIK